MKAKDASVKIENFDVKRKKKEQGEGRKSRRSGEIADRTRGRRSPASRCRNKRH